VRLQEQVAKTRFERMQRIASDRLLDLRQQQVVVPYNEIANGLALRSKRVFAACSCKRTIASTAMTSL
jgi:hypothetical protein